ncbi:MAG: GumC family protein [Hyphomicrobiaceae bacterium]
MLQRGSGWTGRGEREAAPRPFTGHASALHMRRQMAPQPVDIGTELRMLMSAFAMQKRLIAAITCLSLFAGLMFLMLATPQYLATAQILIDPRGKRVTGGEVIPPGLGSSSIGADALQVDSQVEIINSDAVLVPVARETGLASDPEFMIPRQGSMRARLRNALGALFEGFEPEIFPAVPPDDVAIARLKEKHLRVKRVGNTYVINVEMLSRDPGKAATIANAIAASYLRDQATASSSSIRETSETLESRLAELRERMNAAERAVEQYKASSGLIGSPGLLVNEQQLHDLNARLIFARDRVASAEARAEQIRDITRRRSDVSATLEALQSPVISGLRVSLGRVAQKESELRRTLGPKHPDFIAVRAEREGITRLIREELVRIRDSSENELALARSNAAALERELEALKKEAVSDNAAQVRLRELVREADAAKTVFEAYLLRTKEAREQEGIDTDNSRILTMASIPERPVYPATMLVVAAALLGGLALALGIAWLRFILGSFRRD